MGQILTLAAAARWADIARRRGQHIVATNGCFDLLHYGHVRYLQRARRFGDALIVGLNSDRSVRMLNKALGRPIQPHQHRAAILAALSCVDVVVIFHEPRADRFLAAIRPHTYCKGGDYRPETLDPNERAVLTAIGARIRIIPLVKGCSTTALIRKIQSLPAEPSRTAKSP